MDSACFCRRWWRASSSSPFTRTSASTSSRARSSSSTSRSPRWRRSAPPWPSWRGASRTRTAAFVYALGFTTHRRRALRAHAQARKRAGCRRRPSSASSTSWRRPRRSSWPTARPGRRGDQGHPRGKPALGHLAGDHPARGGVRGNRTLSLGAAPAVSHDLLPSGNRHRQGWSIRWWDFLFYLSFGIVITFSVPIAGVLLVFSFLVVPAAIAFQFTRRQACSPSILAGRRRSVGHRAARLVPL